MLSINPAGYKYIQFHNHSDLPVMINSWIDGSNILQGVLVNPHETSTLHSSVGEWHIHSMFTNSKDRNSWKDIGLGNFLDVGKFRSQPCESGNYSWMSDSTKFACIYSKTTYGDICGLITFTLLP